jgi:hypothetical protein
MASLHQKNFRSTMNVKNLISYLCLIFLALSSFVESVERVPPPLAQLKPERDYSKICQKLEQMAKADQALREFLIEELINSSASQEEQLSFLCSMINFKRTTLSPEEDGFIEKYDRRHYEELKRLLAEDETLKEKGWPVISQFGEEADFHAWLICQHASFDREWQKAVLLPRLKNLLAQGEINPAGYAWLSDPSLENLDGMEKLLAEQGMPWSSMIPKIDQMRKFFKIVQTLLSDSSNPV